ncbi:carbon-nitrogen hydrolase family protein [Staphylococcus sp. ACRSN]|uniref:carbon-nitrogen hydrolase family protein n=1 Tax=Staphylococcus sp. ACRSN TaxID=2918214 RepID=UPI001EF3D3B6|nr:carbon-nitrogen hydrolase family protein [Staphylococcus sp. ACRSN]MCG7338340.1 carbon-nitrogen hydrolase family protein [Staphylococcus sp. ACRSN]
MIISLAQFEPNLGDLKHNIDSICDILIKESELYSDLVLFPELSISGYIQEAELLDRVAFTDTSRILQKIKTTCADYNIDTVVSFPEVEGTLYFISSLYIDHKGEILGKYRKTHLFSDEQNLFHRGHSYPIVESRFGNVGLMICYDLEFPEVARILKLKGAEFILISTANMEPYAKHQDVYIASRALENEIPIAIANQYGSNGEFVFFGHSAVYDHNANCLLQLEDNATVDRVKFELDVDRDPQLDYINQLHQNIYQQLSHAKGERDLNGTR